MNSNSVLNKIMTLLSVEKVKFTYAKLEDGTIVESPTFDVGEPIEVVTEEGKTPAPDGEHNLYLRDEEGNEVHIRVIVKDGVIEERENVEELQEETIEVDEEKQKEMNLEEETLEPEALPGEPSSEEEMKVKFEESEKKIEELSYRIEELEKAVKQYMQEVEIEVEEDDEEELPSLNGAPVEMNKVNLGKPSGKGNKVNNLQGSFLSKLYNN